MLEWPSHSWITRVRERRALLAQDGTDRGLEIWMAWATAWPTTPIAWRSS
jgi:hypothetical protein